EPPPGEYWTLPLVGHRPSRLLRLSALPPPPAHLDVVQPRKLRLDDDLRLPPEIDPPAVPSAPERPLPVRPRTPLARAPLHRLVAWDPVPQPELVPEKEWAEIADPQALAPAPPLQRRSREAYLQWRTLMDALDEA